MFSVYNHWVRVSKTRLEFTDSSNYGEFTDEQFKPITRLNQVMLYVLWSIGTVGLRIEGRRSSMRNNGPPVNQSDYSIYPTLYYHQRGGLSISD